ncbi:MAG TPA: S8 family serine peptidase, partial [Patescibacteria group bacterium]|nr:S8 family serine peptidase [Patescibacteria group bacterium]
MGHVARVAFGGVLLVAIAIPAALVLGARPEAQGPSPTLEAALVDQEARRALRQAPPPPVAPPAEFAPFGRAIEPRYLQGDATRGRLLTNLGHVDWDAARDDLAATIPPALRLGPSETTPGARGTLRPGLDFVRLDAAALAARGADEALRSVQTHARIVGVLPGAALIVWVEPQEIAGLARDPFVDRTRAVEPFHLVDPALGTMPRLSRGEAANPDLLATVAVVPGLDGPAFRRRLESMPGVSDISPFASEGAGYQLRVNYRSVKDLARLDGILSIAPVPEYLLANAENVPTIQAGSAEDANFARPFDDAGVDGGGIDTSGDGRRINDGSDAVPPQIVAVVDNGISADTPSFSQTATQVTTALAPFGPMHRKIHSIQPVVDSGNGCDAPLSGGSTHGNVVASAIAAWPSFFGVYATKAGIGGPAEPRAMNLDGVARGARILLEDAATSAVCSINTVIERGGNISPGSLLDRLNSSICPVSGGTGACSGLIGGGQDAHLAVLPFGVPNWFGGGEIIQIYTGQYPQASADVDKFLYNNRDYMVFVPVGNNGGRITDARFEQMTPVFPDSFYPDTVVDPDPTPGDRIQVSAPSTAKNIVTVGSSMDDCFTIFGTMDCEGRVNGFTARGPATDASLRMAPIVIAPAFDLMGSPYTSGVAVFRSSDNDNIPPIEARLDEGNYGSSYSAAYLTGAGAIVRDYFAQGFYPSATRTTSDRMPRVSGALVKAALAAS